MEQDNTGYGISGRTEEMLSEFVTFYEGGHFPGELFLHKDILEQLLRLERAYAGGMCGGKACIGETGSGTAAGAPEPALTVVRGRAGSGRKYLLKTLACLCGKNVLMVESGFLFARYMEYGSSLLQLLQYRAEQCGAWLCICDRKSGCDGNLDSDSGESGGEDEAIWTKIYKYMMQNARCFVTADERTVFSVTQEIVVTEFTLPEPGIKERERLWEYLLDGEGLAEDVDLRALSVRYRLNAGEIRRASDMAERNCIMHGRSSISMCDISKAVLSLGIRAMDGRAVKVPCVFVWEDFVAEDTLRSRLEHLCSYIRYRELVGEQWGFYEKRPYGNGVCAMFCGPPGTGKTMAAQIIAGELGFELYRVDLSQMQSKYIGETQKNISGLFERAKEKNAVLFFDEADALFAKRTRVKDANDRHANAETAHLLQKLEEYDGITILATNLKGNIDEAFRRRIRMIIPFHLPDADTRHMLWKKAFPERAPVGSDIDLRLFAERFEISGSEIKEAAYAAAFLAAEEADRAGIYEAEAAERTGSCAGVIRKKHLTEALKNCMEKYGRVLSEIDFVDQAETEK